jgi:predicted nucleic acid-binding protein
VRGSLRPWRRLNWLTSYSPLPSRLAGELRQNWLRKGKTFSVPDMIIAAICITEKLTLVTDNRKDFAMPEVKLHPLEA